MNIRDLQYVVAVADSRHFGKAAHICAVSQPTLSGQIKKLELQLGVNIFERNNRNVVVTETGRQIILIARRILQDQQAIYLLADQAKDPLAGAIRLGAFPTLAPYYFADLVQQLEVSLPNIQPILIEEKTAGLIEKLRRGEIDAALLALPIKEDDFEAHPLFEDIFVLAVPVGHPLATHSEISQADLTSYRLLLIEEGHCFRDQALDICQTQGIEEDQSFRATGLETLRQIVKAGRGITFMPRLATKAHDAAIVYRPFCDPAPHRKIGLVWRKMSVRSALMTQIVNILKR